MQKRVLVTGATGFIGRQSLLPLLEKGYEVHALYTKKPLESDSRIMWHKADLLDTHSSAELCNILQPTHLLHFAWHVNPSDYKVSPLNDVWKDATIALIQSFKEAGGARAVLAGTCMEYGAIEHGVLNEYTSPIAPTTKYGLAKNETRVACERYAKENNLSLAWGRIFNLYGPYESRGRLMPNAITSLLKGEQFTVPEDKRLFDYSYVLDTAGAFVALLDSNVMGPINIASGKPITLKEIIEAIADIIGTPGLVRTTAGLETGAVVADTARLANEVGWIPSYDLRAGLIETINWWRQNT